MQKKFIKQSIYIALLITLAIAPLFALTVKGWSGYTLALASLLSITLLVWDWIGSETYSYPQKQFQLTPAKQMRWVLIITLSLALPILAILISQALRDDWTWRYYDAPSRFLLAIPVFLYIYNKKIDTIALFQYSFPVMTILTLALLPHITSGGWSGSAERVTSYFVDPLTFGHVTLTIGLLCLYAMNLRGKDSWALLLLKFIGFVIGVYLSIKSGSRTGWMAIPLVLAIWCFNRVHFKNKIMTALLATAIAVGGCLAAYQFVDVVKNRTNEAIKDISVYQLDSVSPITSIGQRLSFFRMGIYYFTLKPLTGWGDQGFKEHINDPEISRFSQLAVRESNLHAGFHNEFTTNAVRSGIWGLISTCLLFFAPLILFISTMRSSTQPRLAMFGIAYMVCELASAMSTEVWNLKFTAALSALLIASLCGTILASLTKHYTQK
ncbi:O-antigen ligase [Methylotenera sp.]|uniref:O-antigen ligase family protein n=1 Tax=Methylotenera sp. TaxID=2051956 RepID=UPI002489F4EB|nr:O-antigen ligase family protein [Methylotenera sp.]MDI1361608.1 O-antigen ligase family protein [Methylotenera sp.]